MKTIISLVLVLMLTGCGSSDTVTVCTYSNDITESTETITSNGDEVKKVQSELSYKIEGLTGDELETYRAAVDSAYAEAGYGDIDQISYSIKISETAESTIVATMDIDYANADLEKLLELGLINSTADHISLEDTISSLESQEFTCE